MIGQTISHYQILEKLGQGGMGVVYKAQDLKLNRLVALKFLPPELTYNAEAVERFINEAQAASALDHTNICSVHEIGETEEGRIFIVMAFYPGETLQKKLERGALPVDEALSIATQVAQGLERAHEAGIVHRDIKPSNLIITPRGEVKIIDFGIAKLSGQSNLTRTGMALGTVAYMSPEQVQREPVDHRTDIWSLGVVLYEMLHARLPFEGEGEAAMIFSIVSQPLRPQSEISSGLLFILDKALAKEPEARYLHMAGLLADLHHESQGASDLIKPATKVKRRTSRQTRTVHAAIAIVSVLILVLAFFIFNRQRSRHTPPTHQQVTFIGNAGFPAISPDGQFIAYAAGNAGEEQKVLVQDLAGGQHLDVFSGINLSSLRWSPDGSELMFWAKRDSSEGIFIVPRLGGSPRHLPMLESSILCWSPDGSQIASSGLPLRCIRLINKSTGDTTAIRVSGAFVFLRELDWTPTGNRLLFMTTKQHRTIIWTIKSDGTQQQRVAEDSIPVYSPRWSANGRAIYYLRFNGQTKDLMKVRISPKTGKARTAAYVLQTGLQPGEFFTLAKDNKRLLYLRVSRHSNLWRVTLAGEGRAQSVEIHKLTTGTSSLHRPRLSPDGESVAFSTGDQPYSNIFVIPFAGGAVRQLTFLDNQNINPVWSPDGKKIAFGSIHRGNPKIWCIAATGGTPRPFERTISSTVFHLTWAPGPEILYPQIGNRNFHFLNPRTEEERPLVANDSVGRMFYPRYSPDAKKMAAYWNRVYPANLQGLWVISLRDSSQTRLLRGKVHPLEWSTDGKWIYAWNTEIRPLAILEVPVDGGQAQTVVTLPFENIDSLGGISMTPDGKRIVCASLEVQSDVWLMENFDPEVE